ncbi:MAG: beta strand repeat-containing protein, partial [Gemmobacter sp.]
ADLGDITAASVGAVARLANETVAFAGDLGKAAVTIYGTTGGARDIFNIDGATMGTATFNVAGDAVLQGRAAKLSGITGAGAGTIEVTALEATPAADLSLLTATTVTAAANLANQTVAFTGHFGKAAVSVAGTSGGAADVFNIDGATMGTATFAVGPDATLQGAAAKFSGVTVTGTGTVDVTNFTADANLSGLAQELGVIVQVGTNGLDISTNANLGSVDVFNLAENVSVTMTSAQNARLGEGVGTNTVTLSDRAAETTGNLTVESYILANVAQNIFILGTDAQNVTGAAGHADTVRTGARTNVTGTLALGATGTDILEITTTATNISTATTTEVEQINLADGVAATMTRTQHDKIGTAAGTNIVTLTDAGTITAKAVIEGYVLANNTGNDITLTAAGQDVTGAAAHADTLRTGTLTGFVGTVLELGSSGTDEIIVGQTGTDLSGINAGAATTAETLVITGLALTTMTTTQHAAFSSITATGTETIAFSNIAALGTTGVAAVETYRMVDLSGNDFTIGTGAQNVTGAASHADTVRTGAQTTVSGIFALGNSGTDVLIVTTTGTNISAATVTEVEAINLETDVHATISAAQHSRIGTAAGTNIITFSNAAVVTGNAAVEGYVLAIAAGNIFTIGAAGQDVTGSANDDRFNTGLLTDLTGTTIVSGGGSDTLGITTTGTNISGINDGAATGAVVLQIDNIAAVSMTAAQYAGFTTINALGTNAITFTTVVAGGNINPGIETVILAAGTNSVTTMTEGQTVDARALADAQVLTLAGSHNVTVQLGLGDLTSTSTGAVRVEGGDGSNVITTGAGNDLIIGGDGNDTINAGGGTLNQISFGDTLVAGAVAGTVRGVQDSVGTDAVTFVVATDEFLLDQTLFGSTIGANGARLAANQFHAQAGTGAITAPAFDVDGNGAFIFDTTGGDLYFVQAGATFVSGTTALTDLLSAQAAYLIADLTLTGTLAADDFLIVA